MYDENRQRVSRLLKYHDIKYEAKTRIALNIDCPYCAGDEGKHLGIFLDKLSFSCWKCKTGGSLYDVINELTGISKSDFEEFFESSRPLDDKSALAQIHDIIEGEDDNEFLPAKEVVFPPEGSVSIAKYVDDPIMDFLESRKVTYELAVLKDVYIGMTGRYSGRFIIPIQFEGKVVAFQARDMTGRAEDKYLTEGDVSYFLYGYDEIDPSKPVALTEGIFDSWAADNSCSSFTSALSYEQMCLMLEKDAVSWILAWDIGEDGSDAYWKSRNVINDLLGVLGSEKIMYITLPPGEDLSSLGSAKVKEILANPINI